MFNCPFIDTTVSAICQISFPVSAILVSGPCSIIIDSIRYAIPSD